jgi:hypothetical protein
MVLFALNRLLSMSCGVLSVRHHILPIPVTVFSGAVPAQDQGFTTAFCN